MSKAAKAKKRPDANDISAAQEKRLLKRIHAAVTAVYQEIDAEYKAKGFTNTQEDLYAIDNIFIDALGGGDRGWRCPNKN